MSRIAPGGLIGNLCYQCKPVYPQGAPAHVLSPPCIIHGKIDGQLNGWTVRLDNQSFQMASPAMTRPLLVVDGDSFAHRAYHGLPKSIRRKGDRGGGAIVGFANFLLRLVEGEAPRAVLVGWDTLDAPTFRQQLFPPYQGGRHFDDELVEQLEALPEFVAVCGFANAKAAGYEADD